MATNKKPAPGKRVFTATSTTEKQQNFTARTGTADMRSKAKPAPKPAKPIIKRISSDPKIKAQLNEKMKKAPTIKISGSASTVSNKKPSMVDSGSRKVTSGKSSNPLKAVVKRVGTVAREAGDVVNAVKTAGKVAGIAAGSRSTGGLGAAAKNVARQVGETARAAATGKSGTTSGTAARELTPARGSGKNAKTSADLKWVTKGAVVKPGKKRK